MGNKFKLIGLSTVLAILFSVAPFHAKAQSPVTLNIGSGGSEVSAQTYFTRDGCYEAFRDFYLAVNANFSIGNPDDLVEIESTPDWLLLFLYEHPRCRPRHQAR